jgi:GT2 family glycosyltransferase
MDPQNKPLISVVTLNYNQAGVTKEFLESFREISYPHYEILVCDMASAEDVTMKITIEDYPHARLLLSKENLGFAGGNNWGIAQANGDFIFIVNNDTEVTPDLLDKLIQPFFDHANIGVTCPKIRFWDQPGIIQYAGFNPMNHFTGRTSTIGEREPDNGQFNTPGPTHGAHGCAMLVKKEVIERVGMFPQKFFLYYEEWDWSARIQYLVHTRCSDIPQRIHECWKKQPDENLLSHPQPNPLHEKKYQFLPIDDILCILYFFHFSEICANVYIQKTISPIKIFYKGRSVESIFFQLFACEVNNLTSACCKPLQIFSFSCCFFISHLALLICL